MKINLEQYKEPPKRYLANPLLYLSPSSVNEYLACPEKFYLKRHSGHGKGTVKSIQGIPAAVGTCFDIYIKRYLLRQLGIKGRPNLELTNMLAGVEIDDPSLRDELLRVGQNLAQRYVDIKFAKKLIDEGLYDLEPCTHSHFGSFVIYGKPDAVIKPTNSNFLSSLQCESCGGQLGKFTDEGGCTCGGLNPSKKLLIPMDWKVRGYKSKNGASPTPGYKHYVTSDGRVFECHSQYGTPLEKLNKDWAIQMCMYSWMLNNIIVTEIDLPVAIDEITFGNSYIAFTQIRTVVTKEFSAWVLQTIMRIWEEYKYEVYVDANYARCMAYNQLCECAHICKAYEKNQNRIVKL